MTGTLLNVAAILIGGGLGLLFGSRIPEPLKRTVVAGMGLFTAAMGLQMFLKTTNPLIVLGSLVLGTLLGEWWRIEERIHRLGSWLERRFTRGPAAGSGSRFARGFLTASLLFCVGPLAILGAISDGLRGDYNLLAVKSVLDGFASIAFASTLGVGVLFSSAIVFIYQGSISLLGGRLSAILSEAMIAEMSATGGVILFGLALANLLELKPIRVGNFLPALALAPLGVWLLGHLPFR